MLFYVLFDLDRYSDNYLMQEGMLYITYISTTKEDMYNFIRDDLFLTSYNWIEDPEKEEKLGFIAQDIVNTKVGEKIIICNRDRDDTLGYDSGNFEATIAGALKVNILNSEATQEEVNELKNKVSELEKLVNELKNIIDNQ